MCSFSGSAGLTWWGLPANNQWPSMERLFQGRVVGAGVREGGLGWFSRFTHFLFCTLLSAWLFWSLTISHRVHWSSPWYLCFHFPSYLPFLLLWPFQWFPSVSMFKFKPLYIAEVTVSFNLQLPHPYPRPTQYCSVGGMIDILCGTLHCARWSCASW